MYKYIKALPLFIGLLLSLSASGQDMLQDVRLLERSIAELRKEQLGDSSKVIYSAKTIAVLHHYRKHTGQMEGDVRRLAESTLAAYREIPVFSDLLAGTTFVLDSFPDLFNYEFEQTLSLLRSGSRGRIMEILHSDFALSPSEYLSVARTLQNYQNPPLPSVEGVKAAAASSNKNVQKGIVNEAAIIIGLFNFLLERGKEEVVIAYLDRLLGQNGIADLEFLFPTTVKAYAKRDFTYSESFIERLRDAFYEDLQLLSVRLPELLGNKYYYDLWKNDPVAFGFLQLYTMVGLAQQDVPISEIIPLTYRSLLEQYREEEKALNLRMVDSVRTFAEYQQLIPLSKEIIDQILKINRVLNDEESGIADRLEILQNTALGGSSRSMNSAEEPLTDEAAADEADAELDDLLNALDEEETPGEEVEEERIPDAQLATNMQMEGGATKPNLALPFIDGDYQNLNTLLSGGGQKAHSLDLIPGLLNGQLDPATIAGWSTLESYDRYLANPLTQTQMQAAGLELLRQINGKWYQDRSLIDILRAWQRDVVNYRLAAQEYEAALDPKKQFRLELEAFEKAKAALDNALQQTMNFRNVSLEESDRQYFRMSLQVLHNVMNDGFLPQGLIFDKQKKLIFQWEELREVEARLSSLNDKYGAKVTFTGGNPVVQYFQSQMVYDPLQDLSRDINKLKRLLNSLDAQLQLLDNRVLKGKHEALQNIAPFVQLTGVLSHLMYSFHSGKRGQEWLDNREVDVVLFDNSQRPIFLGLLEQQLNQSKIAGTFSSQGLTTLVRSTVNDLNLLRKDPSDLTPVVPDSMAFFRKAMFASNAIIRLLELPIMTDPDHPASAQRLIDRYPALRPIPGLSKQTLDFIYYINLKDHRHAMSSLIRLLTDLVPVVAEAIPPPKKQNEPPRAGSAVQRPPASAPMKKDLDVSALVMDETMGEEELEALTQRIPDKGRATIKFLRKYGYFIADLIDADSGKQVQRLLEQISDPPGSSRIKRREPFTASINGYLGGLVGQERLTGNALTDDESFATFAPTIPVGVTFSKLLGKGPKAPSFSLFLSILDLGSLTTFQLGEDIEGEDQLSFKNVFKPGLQLHWNIKKSPFYMGIGGQYGPQFREFNGEQRQLTSFRYFFTMGVDVVIKRLY